MESLCERLSGVRNHLKTIEVISEQSLVNLQFYVRSLKEEVDRLEENYLKFTGKSKQGSVYDLRPK